MKIHSFEPVVNKNCRILILGSMPGPESIRRDEYYAHPQNKFWDVIYGLFNTVPDSDYILKKQFLLKNGIALWDVIKSCEREGSSDTAIRNVELNEIPNLLTKYPNIRCVFFNGRKTECLFEKNFKHHGIKSFYLGSTSPAHAVPMESRINDWSKILTHLYTAD